MDRFDKAFFRGIPRTRAALRGKIKSALAAHAKTGREHGFHVGAGGIDRKLTGGGQKSIRWPTRISVGTATRGGTLHHTHPKGHGKLSPGDLKSVVTAQNPKGGRNTLWAHSPDGHSAARLSRRAADRPIATRQKLFARAVREEKRSGGAPTPGDDASFTAFGGRLARRLKRYGAIHSASRLRKALMQFDDAIAKAGLIRPGKPPLARRIGFLISAGRNERKYKIGQYLASRKTGAPLPGRRRKRIGTYTGVYKRLAALDHAIAKARKVLPGPPRRIGRKGLPIMEARPSDSADRAAHAGLLEAARMKLKTKLRRRRKKPPAE